MKAFDVGMLLALAAIWGASYLFIRVASPLLGPLVLMEGRVLLAGLVLMAYALATGRAPDLRAAWHRYLVLGAVGGALPFGLIAAAELYIPASLAAILNATTPLFTALVASAWGVEGFTGRRLAGLVIGIAGVAVLVGWSPIPLTAGVIFAIAAMLLASLSYGVGGSYAGRTFRDVPSLALAAGQQVGAAVVLLPFALATLPRARFTAEAIANLLPLALLCTGVAYMIYYPLFKRVGPTNALSVSFLLPVFGLLWGVLFLREPVGLGTLAGLAIILSSMVLVTGLRLRPARAVPAAS